MRIRQMLVDKNRYKYKCPYSMNATRIVVHNTANDASANNEIKYMISNNNEVSFHLAVDDKEAVQGIPFNRNTWNAGDGNGKGNREGYPPYRGTAAYGRGDQRGNGSYS